MITINQVIIIVVAIILIIGSIYIFTKTGGLGMLGVALGIFGMLVSGLVGYNAYSTVGPTIYNINASGVVTQGSAIFKICSDPTGLTVVNNVDWGNIAPGETKSIILYIFNTGTQPSTFSISTKDWVPLDANAKIEFTYTLTTNPLQPGQFRKVPISVYIDPSITVITNFSFNVVVTGETP